MLVQLWCEQQTKLESTDAGKTWEEIASEVSVNRVITSAQCQRKIKHLKTHYKKAKDANRNQTGGERNTSPFYDEVDSILGCRDIVHFHNVEKARATS